MDVMACCLLGGACSSYLGFWVLQVVVKALWDVCKVWRARGQAGHERAGSIAFSPSCTCFFRHPLSTLRVGLAPHTPSHPTPPLPTPK